MTASALSIELQNKYKQLKETLTEYNKVIVAFSGGIDSSLLAFVSHQVLGNNMLAVTSGSASLKQADLKLTRLLARTWNMPHRVIQTCELQNPNYAANPVNRCYFCKTELYQQLSAIAQKEGFQWLVNGTNTDDLGDHRPGLKAAADHQVQSPLVTCGFSKQDIRALALFLELPNAEKPQAACLSSRIPYGSAVTAEVLSQIERAETVLAELGFTQFRVRHHAEIARLELLESEMELALRQHQLLQERLKQCGYTYVTLDLGGFRSGSMNEFLL
ncbi:MAG: ATP-dependent sacrificial sulfur transferase LarE [SAR324 cluster bacterium]|nr:ATP-dependent sacrificial sulfur transferase LarE [SAR324 cluster bacterium]